ncbi:uncharacterized protein LOC109791719 [Cajanus cajan]|uniref:uncharacterized protein LOC109791719 n=1 Tax=Cajanus cajan TaxID=3821 RepID=UPI00098D8FFD|nr:uncharacterized protein LOC109791719 [Cajanus cajan]
MKAAQSRKKSYADKRRKPLEFSEGEHVFLKVTPTTGVGRAIKAKKLNLKFIGPYQLRKYIHDPSHVLESEAVQVKGNLTFKKNPVLVAEKKVKQLRGKSINLVKVIWDEVTNEATWELEDRMKDQYPYLFLSK